MPEEFRTVVEAELRALKEQGVYRTLRILDGEQRPRSIIDGREVINLSSNNYLGLTTHPRLKEAAKQAIESLGVG